MGYMLEILERKKTEEPLDMLDYLVNDISRHTSASQEEKKKHCADLIRE